MLTSLLLLKGRWVLIHCRKQMGNPKSNSSLVDNHVRTTCNKNQMDIASIKWPHGPWCGHRRKAIINNSNDYKYVVVRWNTYRCVYADLSNTGKMSRHNNAWPFKGLGVVKYVKRVCVALAWKTIDSLFIWVSVSAINAFRLASSSFLKLIIMIMMSIIMIMIMMMIIITIINVVLIMITVIMIIIIIITIIIIIHHEYMIITALFLIMIIIIIYIMIMMMIIIILMLIIIMNFIV